MFSVTDGGLTWCRLAYWEERSRVGHQVPVTSNAVEVFNQVPRPNPSHDSMCLESLHSLNPKPSQSTVRTREKIGLGKLILLFKMLLNKGLGQSISIFNILHSKDENANHIPMNKLNEVIKRLFQAYICFVPDYESATTTEYF